MPLPTVLALLAAAALAGGCRDDPEPARAQGHRITVVQTDYRFKPQRISAPRGELTIELVNAARLPHNLRLVRRGREYAAQGALLPGERATVTVTLRPGTYRMLCSIANHEELGMYGSVVAR